MDSEKIIEKFYLDKNRFFLIRVSALITLWGWCFIVISNDDKILSLFIAIFFSALIIASALFEYAQYAKEIGLSEEAVIIDKTIYNWSEINLVAFTYVGGRNHHVTQLFIKEMSKEITIHLPEYKERLKLRKKLEDFAQRNRIKIKVEDRGDENAWY